MSYMIRILGIDPGLRHTGWGVIEMNGNKLRHLCSGVISPATDLAFSQRLYIIFAEMNSIIERLAPDCAAIEGSFVSVNAGSAMKLGHARAAAMLAASHNGMMVCEYAPRTVKQALVGTGGADKTQVAAMVAMLLPGTKTKGDEADALSLAICHAHHAPALMRGAK
ncbi:Crossover junction endodeoxyribonuclease RuvC [hydrothermal vent metagenome]|uniref:Crossover junction endodeoxyribonuclease RuvC n=1 Tax=hydrothermal vent metagenome TaxID=652676 RepID=A0A3B0R5I7_9ZZZZ